MPTVTEVLSAGLEHQRAGRLDRAERAYRSVLDFDSGQADALNLLGVLEHERGRHVDALSLIRRAVDTDGANALYRRNLVRVFIALDRLADARAAAWPALVLAPDDVWLHHVVSRLERGAGHADVAVARLGLVVELEPAHALAHNDLGALADEQGRRTEAAEHYRRAVAVDPGMVEAWFNLGCALLHQGKTEEGMAALRHAAEDGHADRRLAAAAHVEIGIALFAEGDVDGASAAYEAASRLNADDPAAALLLVQTRNLLPDVQPATYRDERRRWAERFALKPESTPSWERDRDPDRRLRVAYVGGYQVDGNTAAVTVLPLIEAHDRGAVEIVIYSDLPDWREDAYTARYRAAAELWRNTRELDDAALVAQIRNDRIDVLVDVFGHMSGGRFAMWGARAAPIQVAAIVTGTTGQAQFDYLIADSILLPPELEADVTETVIRVPLAYLYRPSFELPAVVGPPSVTQGHVTFGSFNQLAKLSRPCLAAWARVLSAVPGARLMIKGRGFAAPAARQRFHAFFEARGVAADRLDLRPWAGDFAAHLAAFNECDIALDSFPYNGVTTTCEAFAMGVPVVTLAGDRIAGRYGADLLHAVGLDEAIAADEAGYIERAVALAGDPARLERLRHSLRDRLMTSPLADPQALARGLEAAYRTMWRRWCHADRH